MEAEERGQGEAIARNIYEMMRLRSARYLCDHRRRGLRRRFGHRRGRQGLYAGKFLVYGDLPRKLQLHPLAELGSERKSSRRTATDP